MAADGYRGFTEASRPCIPFRFVPSLPSRPSSPERRSRHSSSRPDAFTCPPVASCLLLPVVRGLILGVKTQQPVTRISGICEMILEEEAGSRRSRAQWQKTL